MALPPPRHIGIIMDGNGRWAKKRFLPRLAGHQRGVTALRNCLRNCSDRGVQALTVFAFSSENWRRPPEEVSGLMKLLIKAATRELAGLREEGVRTRFIGDRSTLPAEIQQVMQDTEQKTQSCTHMTFNICFNYGGRWDIVQAAQQLQQEGLEITENSLSEKLSMTHVPDPDLVIRTGGEQRVSNFMLWQAAYAEWYFTDTLWPQFNADELDRAIASFHSRERRFGKTSEQVQPSEGSA